MVLTATLATLDFLARPVNPAPLATLAMSALLDKLVSASRERQRVFQARLVLAVSPVQKDRPDHLATQATLASQAAPANREAKATAATPDHQDSPADQVRRVRPARTRPTVRAHRDPVEACRRLQVVSSG
jgi:hypothetical protein